jgi:hypothetical protein
MTRVAQLSAALTGLGAAGRLLMAANIQTGTTAVVLYASAVAVGLAVSVVLICMLLHSGEATS